MVDNDRYIEHLKVWISIGIQLCYYGINIHIIVILITYWIKSILIIVINKIATLIKLQTRLQSSTNTSRSSLTKLEINIETTINIILHIFTIR